MHEFSGPAHLKGEKPIQHLQYIWIFISNTVIQTCLQTFLQIQAVESWLVLVRALARQWFGVWIRPKIPADEWLLEGLAGYLENLFLAKYLGRNELLYR